MRNQFRRIVAILATLGLLLVGLVLTAGPSQATSLKYHAFGQRVCIKGKCVPLATIGLYVKGNGKTITRISASIDDNIPDGRSTAGRSYCNWRMQWTAYDTNNRVYWTSPDTTHNVCEGASKTIGRNDNRTLHLKYYGRFCATLFENGVAVKGASVCTSIVK